MITIIIVIIIISSSSISPRAQVPRYVLRASFANPPRAASGLLHYVMLCYVISVQYSIVYYSIIQYSTV